MATNGTAADSQSFTWNVDPRVVVTALDDTSNVEGDAGLSLPVIASETGATLAYTATALPDGLSIDSSTGVISGSITSGAAVDSPFNTVITVSDGTYSTDQSFWWTITNGSTTAPTLTNPGTQVNVVGDSVSLQVSASDTDGGTLIYDAVGLPDGLTLDPISGIISGTVVEDSLSASAYVATVYVTDFASGIVANQTFSWIVNDSAMSVAANAVSATEGADGTFTVATFTDSDPYWLSGDFTVSIQWGDGTTDDNVTGNAFVSGDNGSFTVTDDHVYGAPGAYSVVIQVSDGFQTVTTTGTATVGAALFAITGGFMQGVVAGSATDEDWASFTDGNPTSTASDFAATIDWGDGASSSGTITGGDGAFVISGSHAYATKGAYDVTVTVDAADGATGTVTSMAQVGDLFAGVPSTLTVATFAASNPTATASQFTANVDWGDGSSVDTNVSVTQNLDGSFSVQGAHAYAVDSLNETGGVYVVAVAVAGPDSETINTTTSVSVVRPPTTGVGGNVAIVPGVAFSGVQVASFTEPDVADSSAEFTATIYWGDGTSSSGTVTGSKGAFNVFSDAPHTYATGGTFPIGVEVFQAWDEVDAALFLTGIAARKAIYPIVPSTSKTIMVGYPFNQAGGDDANIFKLSATTTKEGLVITAVAGPGFKQYRRPRGRTSITL